MPSLLSRFDLRTTCITLVSASVVLMCQAESFTSSASSAGSASSGSVSASIKGSSNSSTGDNKVAEGPYRVMEVQDVAAASGQKPMTQLTLRATAPGPMREFVLELPRLALAEQPLAKGDLVQANQRPYGFEFARFDTQQAFFLVLTDDWQRELDSHPVTL